MRILKRIFSRFSIVALTIILFFIVDVLVICGIIYLFAGWLAVQFPQAASWITIALQVLGWLIVFLTALHAANRDMVPETKIPWILCIVFLNIFGVAIYCVFSSHRPTRKVQERYRLLYEYAKKYENGGVTLRRLNEDMRRWSDVSEALFADEPSACVYENTKTEYFPTGELFWARLLEDLERAEKYIFMEYFIISRGEFWDSILEVLARKVKEGVEVRFMYDDIGCMGKVHLVYHKKMEKLGIKCVKFNPFVPVVTNVHNNRDHRKITVIDGRIAYTGGINLADEYVNVEHPFGNWKDTAVRLEGEGVKGLLLMFLKLYNISVRSNEDFSPYIPPVYEKFEGEGFVQPYGSGPRPMYARSVGEDVYINILNTAKDYVWIMTPYLVIDYRLREALVMAAARGVDVRIITPYIPDKRVVFALTRSNYLALIRAGVKIYEYTPGFIHAKGFLSDDKVGTVGTINCDYRSFLFHFEDAVFMYRTRALVDMKRDFEQTFAVSALQTESDAKRNVVWRGVCELAKIFAPLF